MTMSSFVCFLVATCLFLACQSSDYKWSGTGTYSQTGEQQDANPHVLQQSIRQALFEAFLEKILQKSMLVDVEENFFQEMGDQDAVEETADQLTAVIRYVGVGYNLLRGSPDGDFDRGGIDPGIKSTWAIFDFTYDENKDAYFLGSSMQVPDQVNFQPLSSCSKDHRNSVYSGAKSYQKSLNIGFNVGATLMGFQFGLSAAIKRAKEKTDKKKRVYFDQKQICNLGQVRYLTDRHGVHKISKSFYRSVRNLPIIYNEDKYMKFIEDWGTHIIFQVDVGTKNINRSSSTYNQVYQQLKKQRSGGIKAGGNFAGYGGSLGLDIGQIKTNNENSSKFRSHITSFAIGSKKNPYPISFTLENITEVLMPHYWTALPEEGLTYESLGIARKKGNLGIALVNYAAYKGATELNDPLVQIKFSWPNGEYALPATPKGCPKHWSSGSLTQATGSDNVWSNRITEHIGGNFGTKMITLRYCVKKDTGMDLGFDWPEGSYCVARKGGFCPDNFKKGSITWNDRKSSFLRRSRNSRWGELPDGEYGKNTKVFYCCRSDAPSDPIILPIGEPFVLYRYGGTCLNVSGTILQEESLKFDSSSVVLNKNKCTGVYPDDDNCKGDHTLHFCYYSKKN